MKGSPEVITALQAAAAAEARLYLQYSLDARSLTFMGINSLASKISGFAVSSRGRLSQLTDRILFLGGTPEYEVGKISERSKFGDVLSNALTMEGEIIGPYQQSVNVAAKQLDNTTRDLLAWNLAAHETNVAYIEQQQALVIGLGGEEPYLRAMLAASLSADSIANHAITNAGISAAVVTEN